VDGVTAYQRSVGRAAGELMEHRGWHFLVAHYRQRIETIRDSILSDLDADETARLRWEARVLGDVLNWPQEAVQAVSDMDGAGE